MSLKFVFVAILYQFVISEQKAVEKVALDSKQFVELQNLLKQLELQIDKEHKAHKHSGKQKGKGIIEGNDVLNLLLQRDHYVEEDQSKEDVLKYNDDRDCKYGRCGCSRGRCGDERAESSSDEVTKLLDSLEKTIDNDMGRNNDRCGNGRCGGDRDGKSDDLRCRGGRCGGDRDGKSDDLRCRGGRCGGDRDGKSDDLRCRGGRCGGNKDELDDRDDDDLDLRGGQDIKQQLERYGKTYKLNNQLDAIVLRTADVNNAIDELNKHCHNANCKLIDYSRTRTNQDVDEKDNINAVVLDLTQYITDNNLHEELNNVLDKNAKAVDAQQDHLTPDDLDRYYQDYKKTAINNILRYVNDKSGRRESMKNLTSKQRQLVENVRSQLLKGGIGLNEKGVMKQVERILFGKHSSTKIYPHNEHNRNIYVPKHLYDRVGNLRVQKRLLPLTLQQRNKLQKKPMHLWRRKSGSGYGVPFDIQVQGLGQVVP